MDEAHTIKQHLWRLGCLLSGGPDVATEALIDVLRIHPDPSRIALERARRLLLIQVRERAVDPLNGDRSPPPDLPEAARPLWRVASRLEPLQREAWALREVLRIGEVEASRITGIPKSALASYLSEARGSIFAAVGPDDPSPATALLRSWMATGQCAPHIAEVEKRLRGAARRRRLIAAMQLLLLLIVMGVFAWIGRDLLRASERERHQRALQQEISNPMSPEDSIRERRQDAGSPGGGGPR